MNFLVKQGLFSCDDPSLDISTNIKTRLNNDEPITLRSNVLVSKPKSLVACRSCSCSSVHTNVSDVCGLGTHHNLQALATQGWQP